MTPVHADQVKSSRNVMEKNEQLKRGVDYIGVNCVFWCHDSEGKILMHKRSNKCRDEHGRWDCGSGSMEFGETFEDTVRREVMEEYGVEPLKIEYITTGNVLREHDGHTTHWVKNLHWVLVDPSQVKNMEPEKMEEIGWFSLDDLPTPLHSQITIEVEIIKNFIKDHGN